MIGWSNNNTEMKRSVVSQHLVQNESCEPCMCLLCRICTKNTVWLTGASLAGASWEFSTCTRTHPDTICLSVKTFWCTFRLLCSLVVWRYWCLYCSCKNRTVACFNKSAFTFSPWKQKTIHFPSVPHFLALYGLTIARKAAVKCRCAVRQD